jgi:hypothetical protein
MEPANTARRETSATAEAERRALVRVKLDETITAQILGGDESLPLQEASVSGFSLRTTVPIEPGTSVHFRLSDSCGQVVFVGATCRYCTALEGSDPPAYLAGFQLQSPPDRRVPLVLGIAAEGVR